MTESNGPLDGIRVLDLSRVLAGPYCTMTLGDLGADVIKVEQPGKGDDTRAWGPPWAGGEAGYYLTVNRNKRSITVDIKSEQGKQIIRDLARESDIIVENFKHGTFERLGLGFEDLRVDNPGLIWANVSGYGPTGPLANKPGYDFIAQGEAGIMAITGEPDGEPMKVGVAIVDVTAGLFATVGVLSALHARETSGVGQRVDASLFTSAIAWLVNVGQNHLVSGKPAKRYGNAHANIVPYQTFRARDQYMTLGVGNNRQFQALCAILGRPELAQDERYATNSARVANREEIVGILQSVLETEDADHWISACDKANIPSGKINTIEQVFEHPQTLARDMLVEVEHPTAGMLKMAGIPFAMSETPPKVRLAPPLLGQHTDEVLRERLGYDQTTIDQLRTDGII